MIPLFKPSVGKEEIEALKKTFKSGWIGMGPKTAEFEEKFAKYIDVKHAIGVNSCTAALHLALSVLGVNSGEVIVPSITFVSTAHAALYNNAKPVFADVDEETLCMNVEDMQEKITDKTKAIIPVHLGGHPCDMDPIMEIAREKDIFVIEDAANATGTEYKGRKVGSIGDIGCFSFEAKKVLTTGDGGMITTDNDNIVNKLKRLRWVGINKGTWERKETEKKPWYYEVLDVGYKYNMNDIQATIGLVQLKKLERMNEKRRKIFKTYIKRLSGIEQIQCPIEKEWAKSAWWLFIIKTERRDEFVSYMAKNGITTGVHFMPLHLHPIYRNYKVNVPVAESVWKKIVDIPFFPDIAEKQINEVVSKIKNFFK